MEIVNKKTSELHPYKNNPRINNKAVDKVAASIKEFGFKVPIVIDKNNVIVAGHTRLHASKRLGLNEVPCIVADDLSDEQIKAFRLADNKVGELATWDESLLDIELKELADVGFDMEPFSFELPEVLVDADLPEDNDTELSIIDYAEETQRKVENILNLAYGQYEGAGPYDIPILKPVYEIPKVEEWVGFNYALTTTDRANKGVHFYVDDYQFERVWNRPEAYLDLLSQFACVLTPDFSPYGDMPLATQIFNHYRKHWVGRYWQENGLTVIPTIRASSDVRSMDFYLDGEPEGGIVSISTMWASIASDALKDEFEAMVEVLRPSKILVYGEIFDWIKAFGIELKRIPTFSDKRWGG